MPADENSSNLYLDLALEFSRNNHQVYVIAPALNNKKTELSIERGINVLRVKANKQIGIKSVLKKGWAQFLLPYQYKTAYLKHLNKIQFDLILMPTPPITLINLAIFVKKLTKAKLYLILRDIYPQGAADIGLVKYKFIYTYLKKIEKKTYSNADIIGCMSQGNIDYILKHNPDISTEKMALLPNWQKEDTADGDTEQLRKKYNFENKYLVLFGGTIGYAQKVENIVLLADHYRDKTDIIFLVIGNGVKKGYLIELVEKSKCKNVVFMDSLPRDEYMNFVSASDIGLITIDERFTVPTIPSKTTSYMCNKLPILAIIDPHTDYKNILEEANAGLWSIGGDNKKLFANFDLLYNKPELRNQMGESGYSYFMNNLTPEITYRRIKEQLISVE